MRRYRPNERTVAYRALATALDQVSYVLKLEGKLPDPPTGRFTAKANALRAAALTLMVAQFEYFLRSAFIEFADRINVVATREKWKPDADLLDRSGEAFVGYMRNFKGSRSDRLAKVRQAAAAISGDGLVSDAFGDTRASPKPETVREMFETVGTVNVWPTLATHYNSVGAPEPESIIVQKLRHLCEARNEVIHAGAGVKFSRAELHDYLLYIRRLAGAVDAQLRAEFKRFAP